MIRIQYQLKPTDFENKLREFWNISGEKIRMIRQPGNTGESSPVFTVQGKYSPRGWTEWTQGFQIGSAILQFDATEDSEFTDWGKKDTIAKMAGHVSDTGVHDHGFNNISTYGNLHRLMREGRLPPNSEEKNFYELALKVSGAVQANRWTRTRDGGFIYSFNGPHSLFIDTIRSCRILIISHLLNHSLKIDNDVTVNLLHRAMEHLSTSASWSVFYGEGRDVYDVWGRVAHESIFNTNDGCYRCPGTQQGYSGFTTWTRGLAWAMLGFSEQLEFLHALPASGLEAAGGKEHLESVLVKAATATCDFYINNAAADGIPYWDTGAPGLSKLGDYLNNNADPFNDHEPVDSSAASIAAQGLLRLGNYYSMKKSMPEAERYGQAGLTIMDTLLGEPYLSKKQDHQGLILHAVYHRPNGWDYIPEGKKIPCGESSMWGDYHAREAALYLQRLMKNDSYYTFFSGLI